MNFIKMVGQLYWSFLKLQLSYAGALLAWVLIINALVNNAEKRRRETA